MDLLTFAYSAAVGIVASAITAYVTTKINVRQERKRFERDLAAKLAELHGSAADATQALAIQFAEGVLVISRPDQPDQEKVFLPSGCRVTLGRHSSNHIVVDSPVVSRTHAAFSVVDSVIWLEPLGPRNPLEVNGERVTGRTRLRHGDVVSIGKPAGVTITLHALPR